MKFETYQRLVANLRLGKRLPDAVYLHESCLSELPPDFATYVHTTSVRFGANFHWNVVKLYRKDFKISLLSYPKFYEDSYPELSASMTIDLVRARSRISNFAKSKNPPILHRKETLIAPHHEAYRGFAEITKEGEKAGLYESRKSIGFKKSWERIIDSKGLQLIDGRLAPKTKSAARTSEVLGEVEIQRHLTAVDRDKLSAPMQSLAKYGYLDGEHTIFDYGCGKGHDLLELEAHGIDASGWDPAYRPDTEKRPSDIVNLGYVVNVIEDFDERATTLKEAYELANKLLVVSAMLGGDSIIQKFSPYKDGVVTSRGTFQKYYSQSEFREFLHTTLDVTPTAIGPGLFYVFRDELEEQSFLSSRQRVHREWSQLHTREKSTSGIDNQTLINENIGLFKEFWQTCLDFGRAPANDEFERSMEIRKAIGSHRKALTACKDYFGDQDYEKAKLGRKKDLTVFLALSFFDRQRAYVRMPLSLQRDIRAFFEKPSCAYDFAKQALFAIADKTLIADACQKAYGRLQSGRLDAQHSYTIRTAQIPDLPPVLRIYVGVALHYFGDADKFDLVKIHIRSGKVSLMEYDDFSKPLPLLRSRAKICMHEQQIELFDHSRSSEPQPLYQKSVYLTPRDPDYGSQVELDKLQGATGLDFSGFGPPMRDFYRRIKEHRIPFPIDDSV